MKLSIITFITVFTIILFSLPASADKISNQKNPSGKNKTASDAGENFQCFKFYESSDAYVMPGAGVYEEYGGVFAPPESCMSEDCIKIREEIKSVRKSLKDKILHLNNLVNQSNNEELRILRNAYWLRVERIKLYKKDEEKFLLMDELNDFAIEFESAVKRILPGAEENLEAIENEKSELHKLKKSLLLAAHKEAVLSGEFDRIMNKAIEHNNKTIYLDSTGEMPPEENK